MFSKVLPDQCIFGKMTLLLVQSWKNSTVLLLLLLCNVIVVVVNASWTLMYQEDFTDPLEENDTTTPWELETYSEPFDTIMDDSGDWYRNDYGPDAFDEALYSFDTYRKEFTFGTNGWLTASLSARDWDKDGISNNDNIPELYIETMGNDTVGTVLTMNVKDHTGGVILRPTNALPEAYRIEYKLRLLDFGGKRQGSIEYEDGRINGYSPHGCKTQHPWGEGSRTDGWTGNASVPYCEWQSVREGPYGYNGFHFLTIVDVADPAPRNNHFWHYRRKLLMDSFSVHPDRVGDGSGGQVCDASTNQYYDYKDSESWTTVNMWISGLPGTWTPNPGGLAGNSQNFMTNCNGQQASRGLQSAGELIPPESLPQQQFYTFAMERNASGYTMEASGYFARAGFQTFRFFRPFVVEDEPIWHYNVKASEYDGRYNNDLQQENWAHGSQTWPDQWPAGSAYPDYFVIGDLYTNVYEGRASLSDIRFYVPDSLEQSCEPTILLNSDEEFTNQSSVIQKGDVSLRLAEDGNLQVLRQQGENDTEGYKTLLWESGVTGSVGNNYATLLQGDGNLIVSQRDVDGNTTILWMTLSVNAFGKFYLVAECEAKGGGVAIYKGLPGQGGYPVWIQAVLPTTSPSTQAPMPVPTPTPTPTDKGEATLSPSINMTTTEDAGQDENGAATLSPSLDAPTMTPTSAPTKSGMEGADIPAAVQASGGGPTSDMPLRMGWRKLVFTALVCAVVAVGQDDLSL
jgi:hypothetical protein